MKNTPTSQQHSEPNERQMSNPAAKRFLTVNELANRWGFATKTIYEWCADGKLPFATRLGEKWRFPIYEVEKYEKAQAVGT